MGQSTQPLPADVTAGELQQAHSLILRGKTFATVGDPRMQRITNALLQMGYRSIQQTIEQKRQEEFKDFYAKQESRPLPINNFTSQITQQKQRSNDLLQTFKGLNKPTPSITTLGGIQTTPPPSFISAGPTPTEQAMGIGTRVNPPTPSYNSALFREAFDEAKEFNFVKATGTLFSPIQYFFKGKEGDKPIDLTGSTFGTIQDINFTSPIGSGSGKNITKTKYEMLGEEALLNPDVLIPADVRYLRAQESISKDLSIELSNKITSGELSLPQAEEEFKTRFESEASKIDVSKFKESSIFSANVSKAGGYYFDVERGGELLATAGLSLTPSGALLVGTSFISEGVPNIGKGLLGSDLSLKERGKLLGAGSLQVGLGLAGGGFGIKLGERQADRLLVSELVGQEGVLSGKEIFRSGGGSLFETTSIKSLGKEARSQTDLLTPVFRNVKRDITKRNEFGIPVITEKGGEYFSIAGGRGTTKTKIFSIEKGEFIESTSSFGFSAPNIKQSEITRGLFGDKTIISRVGEKGFTGDLFVIPKGSDIFSKAKFGGTSQKFKFGDQSLIGVKGGELKLFSFSKKYSGGLKVIGDPKTRIKVRERGFIQPFKGIGEETSSLLFTGEGTKTPLSKTFQKETQQLTPVGLAPPIENVFTQSYSSFKPSSILPTGGAGLKTTQKAETSQVNIRIPSFKESQVGRIQQSNISKSLSSNILSNLLKSRSSSLNKLASLNALSQSSGQKSKLVSGLKQKSQQIQKQKSSGLFAPSFGTPSAFSSFGGGRSFKFPAFFIPSRPKTMWGGKKRVTRKRSPPPRTPSLFAIGRGIKSSSRGSLETSGLTIRPIIFSKPRIRRKIRKKR